MEVLPEGKKKEALRALRGDSQRAAWMASVKRALDVPCDLGSTGFEQALVQALARFQQRFGRFSHEVTGQRDDRTRRYLEMVHPSLRPSDHRCAESRARPHPRVLGGLALQKALEQSVESGDRGWLERLQRSLGLPTEHVTGAMNPATVQGIARFQRDVRAERPRIHPTGVLDEGTRDALTKAYGEGRGEGPGFLPGCLLRWEGAKAEQLEFMERVYEHQRIRAAQRRSFVATHESIAPIEKGRSARPEVAAACKKLLGAARASRPRTTKKADLFVATAFRSAAFQLELWEHHFPKRYKQTAALRSRAPGGEHGDRAVSLLADYYAARTASPGYSLHNSGLAIDFGCVTRRGRWLGATGVYGERWKESWCYRWLRKNASRFGFEPNRTIDEPWHWEWSR